MLDPSHVSKCAPEYAAFFEISDVEWPYLRPLRLKTGTPLIRAPENVYTNFDFSMFFFVFKLWAHTDRRMDTGKMCNVAYRTAHSKTVKIWHNSHKMADCPKVLVFLVTNPLVFVYRNCNLQKNSQWKDSVTRKNIWYVLKTGILKMQNWK